MNEDDTSENEDSIRVVTDGNCFNIINQSGDIIYFFSKSDGYSGYCTKREHYINVTASVLDMYTNGVYKSYSISYYKNEYGNRYIISYDERFGRYNLFCLNHNKSYSGCRDTFRSSSKDICELDNFAGMELDPNWANTPEEFLGHTILNYYNNNQKHLINYILNFIESDK